MKLSLKVNRRKVLKQIYLKLKVQHRVALRKFQQVGLLLAFKVVLFLRQALLPLLLNKALLQRALTHALKMMHALVIRMPINRHMP